MMTDRELDGLIHDWLRDGGSALSDRVFAGVMAGLPTTAQRRGFGPLSRWRALPAPTRFALVSSAAVVVVAGLGLGLFLAQLGPNIGPAVPTSQPSPSPSDTGPSPSSNEAPSNSPTAARRGSWEAVDGLRISFDLPPGWSQPGGTGTSDRYPTPHIEGPNPDVAVNFYDEIVRVWQHSGGRSPIDQTGCQIGSPRMDLATGTTPADLAAKLRSATDFASTEPVDVTLAGFRGKRLTLEIPESLGGCNPSDLKLWIGRPTGLGSPGQRDTLWILDVNGKRVVIEAVSFPGTSTDDLAAQQRLIESIQIEPNDASAPPATEQGRIDSIDGLRITFDKPPGWYRSGADARFGDRGTDAVVSFNDDVQLVWQYPCRLPLLSNDGRTGTTAADLAARFQSAQGYTASQTRDATLAGYRGKHLTLQMPETIAGCHNPGALMLWIGGRTPSMYASAGERHEIWILDVDGVRLLIDGMSPHETSAEVLAAQQQLIDSIRIERVGTEAHPLP